MATHIASTEVAETLAHAMFAAWETHDEQQMSRLLTDDFAFTGAISEPLDQEMFQVFRCILREVLPDWKFTVRGMAAHANTVHVMVHITATHCGALDVQLFGLPLPLIPPTGKVVEWHTAVFTFTVEGERIVACHCDLNLMSLLYQLGVVGWRLPVPVQN
jgi:predicted ester cyclase